MTLPDQLQEGDARTASCLTTFVKPVPMPRSFVCKSEIHSCYVKLKTQSECLPNLVDNNYNLSSENSSQDFDQNHHLPSDDTLCISQSQADEGGNACAHTVDATISSGDNANGTNGFICDEAENDFSTLDVSNSNCVTYNYDRSNSVKKNNNRNNQYNRGKFNNRGGNRGGRGNNRGYTQNRGGNSRGGCNSKNRNDKNHNGYNATEQTSEGNDENEDSFKNNALVSLDEGDLIDPDELMAKKNCNNKNGNQLSPWGTSLNLFAYDKKNSDGNGGNNNNKNNNKNNNNNNNNNNKNNNNNNNGNGNNKNGGGGGGGGEGKWDVFSRSTRQLCYSVGLLSRKDNPGYTLESLCLASHYRLLVAFFYACYLMFAMAWFRTEQIVCFMYSDGTKATQSPFRDICLSYPYVERPNAPRRYLLFYRWVPYAFLVVAAAAYCLRYFFVKRWEEPRLAALYADVFKDRNIYDPQRWQSSSSRVLRYLQSGQPSNLHYLKWILCHVMANLLDIAIFYYFDFTLQGSFLHLVPNTIHKLQRDPANFSDPLSSVFCPFAKCTVTQSYMIMPEREVNYGCHLTFMELYEKLFVVSWIVLIFHWVWSFVMVLWLCLGLVPFLGKFTFVVCGGGMINRNSFRVLYGAVRCCSLGDMHVLFLMKRWMSHVQFVDLLEQVVRMKESNGVKRFSVGIGGQLYPAIDSNENTNGLNQTVLQIEPGSIMAHDDVDKTKRLTNPNNGNRQLDTTMNVHSNRCADGQSWEESMKPAKQSTNCLPSAPPRCAIGWEEPKTEISRESDYKQRLLQVESQPGDAMHGAAASHGPDASVRSRAKNAQVRFKE